MQVGDGRWVKASGLTFRGNERDVVAEGDARIEITDMDSDHDDES